jgi:DNA polymerase-3 subunit chi
MTQIDFYTHVENRLQTACMLAAKALGRNVRMLILTPDAETTERVDKLLWTHSPIGFLPHCRSHHRLAPVTPIILDHVAELVVHEQVLVNLCSESPTMFSRFERLIEIVSVEETDRDRARERYRFYKDRGYEIRTHNISQATASP